MIAILATFFLVAVAISLELLVKSRYIRMIGVVLLVVCMGVITGNLGVSLGRSMETIHYRLHLTALFSDLAQDARKNRADALKSKILRVHEELPEALEDESVLAQLVGEIEMGRGVQPPPNE